MIAAEARLGHEFNKAAHIMHAIFLVNGKQVTPKALNPYWAKTARDSFDVDAIERQYRVLKKNGKILETTITASQVIHDD
jgi:hypothetical protein